MAMQRQNQYKVVAIFLAVGVTVCSMPFLRDALLRQEGYSLIVEQPVQYVSVRRAGDTAIVKFKLRNLSDRQIMVSGIESSCGCIAVDDLPFSVAPSETFEGIGKIKAAENAAGEEVIRRARLFVDVKSPPVMLEVRLSVCEE